MKLGFGKEEELLPRSAGLPRNDAAMEKRNLGCGTDEPLLPELCEGVSELGEVGGVEAASLVVVPEPDEADDDLDERECDEDDMRRVDDGE